MLLSSTDHSLAASVQTATLTTHSLVCTDLLEQHTELKNLRRFSHLLRVLHRIKMEKAHVREEASNSCPLLVYCPLRNFLLSSHLKVFPPPMDARILMKASFCRSDFTGDLVTSLTFSSPFLPTLRGWEVSLQVLIL